jgi:uncharacterized membrane protein (UPF0127 family)
MRAALLAFLFAVSLMSSGRAETSPGLPTVPLTVESDNGNRRTSFIAELAATPADRAKGLMFRNELAGNRGMLFDFKETRIVSMWMKNTPLSLDMIFSDARGVVLHVARDTVPYSEEIITPGMPVYAVFEVKAGTADRLGIRPGDRLLSGVFGTGG